MERNAWRVAHDIALRIDDAPVLSDYIFIKDICNREGGGGFFIFQQDPDNHDYMKASESSKKHVPGYNYFAKIYGYINDHYDAGELYMEFVKGTCKVKKKQQCTSCENGWLVP